MFLKVLDPVYQSWAQNMRSTLFLNRQNYTLRKLTIFLLKAAVMASTSYEQEECKKMQMRTTIWKVKLSKAETVVQMNSGNQ